MKKITFISMLICAICSFSFADTSINGVKVDEMSYMRFRRQGAPPVSSTGNSILYMDNTTNTVLMSENGGAYSAIRGAGGGGGSGLWASTASTLSPDLTWSGDNLSVGKALFVENGGNVGVGNTAPTSKLYVSGDAYFTSALTSATVNTGNGENELYAMDQDVKTTDAVTFDSVDTGNGAYELFSMNQDVESTDAVTFATLDTGQGANELYDMDQNVLEASNVTFANLTSAGNIEAATYGSDDSVTDAELLYINSVTSNVQDQIDAKLSANLTKSISVTITKPLSLDEADTLPIFQNRTDSNFTITKVFSNSDTDDVNFTLKEITSQIDFTATADIGGEFIISTDGTSVYYNLSESITSVIEPDHIIVFNNDAADDPDYVNINIEGYLS